MMKNKFYKNELFICTILFIIAVCMRFFLADFVKTIHSYPDELIYYGISKSLAMGEGISLRNIPFNFQKIGYSFLLIPFFFIQNVFLRIKAISFFNCLIMSASVFPMLGIGRELKLGKKSSLFLVFLTLLWPDMATSMSFMSEILYWPLCLSFVWLWLLGRRFNNWLVYIFQAFLCYIGYLCKEIFLAFFISEVLFVVISPIVNFLYKRDKKIFFSQFSKLSIFNTCIYVFAFLAFHVVFKMTVFQGIVSYYNNHLVFTINNIYNFFYMIHAFFIYVSAVIMAVYVFPIVYPAIYYKRISKETQDLFVFSLLTVLIIAATVAYTISVKEALGSLLPALHLRYVAPVLIVCMAVFLKTCQKNLFDKNNFVIVSFLLLLILIFIGSVFKGMGSVPCSLAWYKIPQKLFATINRGYEFVLRPYVIIVNFCFTLAVFVLHFIKEKFGKSLFVKIFMILSCFLLLVSNLISIKIIKDGYSADKNIINELQSLNNFFSLESESPYILYVSAGELANENAYFDTYFDNIQNLYVVREDDVIVKDSSVHDVNFREPESKKKYNISRIDYILIPSTLSLECENAVLREDLGGRYYSVYKNNDSSRISIIQKSFRTVSFDWNICVSNGFDKDGIRNLDYDGSSYGPYWHLQKGSYKIEIKGEDLEGAEINLYSAKGSVNYPFDELRSDDKILLRFTLPSDVDNFEIYIKNKKKKTLRMTSLQLKMI